jgi:hypothetical protein
MKRATASDAYYINQTRRYSSARSVKRKKTERKRKKEERGSVKKKRERKRERK